MRDLLFFVAGAVVGCAGIGASLLWSPIAGIIAQLLLTVGLFLLLVLQRRQVAKVQARTLEILRHAKESQNRPDGNSKRVVVFEKNILGLLQAQQTNLDLLNQKLNTIASRQDHSSS